MSKNKLPALNQFSLDVAAGETVALVGASGSGKTTLVNLLPRFAEIGSGGVYLDGHELRDWELGALRAQFALVSQHVLMLNDSIAVNVALGQDIDRTRVAHQKCTLRTCSRRRIPASISSMRFQAVSIVPSAGSA